MWARPLLALVLLGCGCSSDPSEPAPEDLPRCDPALAAPQTIPGLEILRDELSGGFAPVADGDLLMRHYGSQGGSHFFVYARVFSADAVIWSVQADLTDASATPLAGGSQGFTGCADQWTQPRQVTVFIEASGDLAGTLSVTAKPEQGTPLSFEAPISVGGG